MATTLVAGGGYARLKAYRKISSAKYLGGRSWQEMKKALEPIDPCLLKLYRLAERSAEERGLEPFEMEEAGYVEADEPQDLTDLERENADLRSYVHGHLPHREIFRVSLLFLLFFSGALTVQAYLKVLLVSPPLAWVGMGLSAAGALLSYLARFDWEDWRQGKA
jgi:hypothetical protein